MKSKLQRYIPLSLAVILGTLGLWGLLLYTKPMNDVSLDLSFRSLEDSISPKAYDDKGWTVYTQEGSTKTELIPNGLGGFTGLELGQTFYFSRVMEEHLDSPTLRLDAVEQQFSVWLDHTLLYTDCPELDNRIGYVTLPMSPWLRDDAIIISLPADYQGKTLTIAQSFPEWSETGSVAAWPASVQLYCGYAYESGLISEAFRTALFSTAAFLLLLILLTGFLFSRDWKILCLAVVAFYWMASALVGTSFYYRYFITKINMQDAALPLISTFGLLCFLVLQGGSNRKLLWAPVAGFGLCLVASILSLARFPTFSPFLLPFFPTDSLPLWFAFFSLVLVMVMGTFWWRKENRFYRAFIPLAFAGIAVSWAVQVFFVQKGFVLEQIALNLCSGQIHYVYTHTMTGITVAALLSAVVEMVRSELDRRAEQHLVEQRKELAISSYENLRHQHDEVMMIRHDMKNHFIILRELSQSQEVEAYLDKLLQNDEKIRPVIQSGNELFDIILNSKINTAASNGIRVEIIRADIVQDLPIPDADLCSLIMNLLDNAIAAASQVRHQPQIELDMHIRGAFFVFTCTNSANPKSAKRPEETALKEHGFGLKIVQNIAERYSCLVQTKQSETEYHVTVAIPLDHVPSTVKEYIPL